MHMCNVRGWFGISLIVVCEKGTQLSQEITFDRVPWKAVPLPQVEAELSFLTLNLSHRSLENSEC